MGEIIQKVSIAGTLRAMEIGSSVVFGNINENTVRHACVRLRNDKVGKWSVNKTTGGFMVTRLR